MVKRRIGWLVLSLALYSSDHAYAQSVNYNAFGYGVNSCGRWLSARRDQAMNVLVQQWLGGYMTAANAFLAPSLPGKTANIAKGTDIDGLSAWIDNYCNTHPLEPIGKAAEQLVRHLSGR